MPPSPEIVPFKEVYKEYRDKIYSYVFYRIGNDRELTEDIVSTVFLKAYQKYDSYNHSYALSTWLYSIARNTIIDYYRTKKLTYELDEEQHSDESDPLAHLLEQDITMTDLESALATLPATQASFIRQQFFEGYSAKEIAKAADTTHTAVRKQISRGLAQLRDALSLFMLLLMSL